MLLQQIVWSFIILAVLSILSLIYYELTEEDE